MRCAGIGSRRHGGDVAGLEQEKTGRCGAAPLGRPKLSRERETELFFDALPHRVHQAARCVQAEDHCGGVLPLRLRNGGIDDFDSDRMDNAATSVSTTRTSARSEKTANRMRR